MGQERNLVYLFVSYGYGCAAREGREKQGASRRGRKKRMRRGITNIQQGMTNEEVGRACKKSE